MRILKVLFLYNVIDVIFLFSKICYRCYRLLEILLYLIVYTVIHNINIIDIVSAGYLFILRYDTTSNHQFSTCIGRPVGLVLPFLSLSFFFSSFFLLFSFLLP